MSSDAFHFYNNGVLITSVQTDMGFLSLISVSNPLCMNVAYLYFAHFILFQTATQ